MDKFEAQKSAPQAPDAKPAVDNRRSFKRVNNILNRVVAKLGLERRLREHTILKLWPVLVGDNFAARSRPLFIDSESSLVVAVADASVGQELSLLKLPLLRQLKSAGRTIGINIAGLRFDLKHFHEPAAPETLPGSCQPGTLPEPTGPDLDRLTLPESDLTEIETLRQELDVLPVTGQEQAPPVSAERILAVFERELRLRHWRRLNGYPLCRECANPTRVLHGDRQLCPLCYFHGS